MTFSARIRTPDGASRTLLRDAPSAAAAVAALRAEGALVLGVREAHGSVATHPARLLAGILPATSLDVEFGLRQLSSMLAAGVTLPDALATVAEQARRPRAATLWREAREHVLAGERFADALARRRRAFGDLTVELCRVGEHAGELEKTLTGAANELEAHRALRASLVGALAYPCLAIALTLGVVAFLTIAVIPKIAVFLRAGGAELPAMTRRLADLSAAAVRNGPALLLALVAIPTSLAFARATPRGRFALDSAALRLPVVGALLRTAGTALFARSMAVLVESGVTLLDALSVCARLLPNARLAHRVRLAQADVLDGHSVADALRGRGEFPPMLSRMASVGEVTGSLGEAFGSTARFHEKLLAVSVRRLSAAVEPALLILSALLVGYVYASFFLALFSLADIR